MLEDIQIEFLVAGGIVAVALIITLIITFVKPGKRLEVVAKLSKDEEGRSYIDTSMKNVGKKKVKLVPPYLRFRRGSKSRLFQVYLKDRKNSYPMFIKPEQEIQDRVYLKPYFQMAEKKLSTFDSVQLIIKDTIGVDFKSEKLKPGESS